MKKELLIKLFVLFILVMPYSIADLDVKVAYYDSSSKLAKLSISNTDQTSYSDVKMSIDGMPEVLVVSLLNPGNSALIPQIVEPGQHDITVSTKEGKSVSKALDFLTSQGQLESEFKNAEELKNIREEILKKRAEGAKERLDEEISKEIEAKEDVESVKSYVDKKEEVKAEEVSLDKYAIIGIAALIIISAILVILLFKKKPFKPQATPEKNVKKEGGVY